MSAINDIVFRKGTTVEVLKDWQPFKKGNIMKVVRVLEEGGIYYAELDYKQGLIPVKLLNPKYNHYPKFQDRHNEPR